MLHFSKTFRYYILPLIELNLIILPIYWVIWKIGIWDLYPKKIHFFLIWLCINLVVWIGTPSEAQVERIEDEWDWIRITRGKEWYHRYIDSEIRKELKNVK